MEAEERHPLRVIDGPGRIQAGAVSAVIAGQRAFLLSIDVSSEGADGYVDVFDGKSNAEERRYRFYSKDGYTYSRDFGYPPLFEKGIYVAPNAATTHYVVQYRPYRTEPPVEM